MDFEDLESKFQPGMGMMSTASRAKMLILCNPHNPVGRVWSKEELVRMGEIATSHDAVIISDEIHCELLFKGSQHFPLATLSKEFEQNCITFMAPSKTFNLAGLRASAVIIANQKLRDRYVEARAGILPQPGIFGLVAMEAAYRYGDEWLEQLLDYLQGNLDFLLEYFENNIPEIKVIKPEGTYLVWLDCRHLGMNQADLRTFFREKAGVIFDDGYLFGSSGDGFQRMNIACPKATLEQALNRIKLAISSAK